MKPICSSSMQVSWGAGRFLPVKDWAILDPCGCQCQCPHQDTWPTVYFRHFISPKHGYLAKQGNTFTKTEPWQVWTVHNVAICISSKRFLRLSGKFWSTYLWSLQVQNPPLCCVIIHLYSIWIRSIIPISNLGEMRKRPFTPKNPNFPAKHNLPHWVAELSFPPPPSPPLWVWQDDRKALRFSRAQNNTLFFIYWL